MWGGQGEKGQPHIITNLGKQNQLISVGKQNFRNEQ